MAAFSSTPVFANSIVVLGDSISASYGFEVDQGWVNLLQLKLNAEKQPYRLVNESISGDTTSGGLARIDRILSKHKPEVVILELGANDGLRGLHPNQMKKNLGQIIERSQKSKADVLLLSMRIPPNYGKRYTEMFYNVYPQLAQDYQVPLIPFVMKSFALDNNFMQHDGLHPNKNAQPIIAETVWEYLQPMLKSE